jgi:transcriptional regulator GlxA family with amidase domain
MGGERVAGVTEGRVREMMRDGVPDRRIAKRLGLSRRGLRQVMDDIVRRAELEQPGHVSRLADELGIADREIHRA